MTAADDRNPEILTDEELGLTELPFYSAKDTLSDAVQWAESGDLGEQ